MVKRDVFSPHFLAFPERLLFGLTLLLLPLLPLTVAPAYLLPLLPAALVGLFSGEVSRLQRLTVLLSYAFSLSGISAVHLFAQLPSVLFFLGISYLFLTWLDAKLTVYALLPGELRVISAGIEDLKLSGRATSIRVENVLKVTRRTPLVSSLFKLNFYDACLLTPGGELRVRGIPGDIDVEAWLRTHTQRPSTRREVAQKLEKNSSRTLAPVLSTLREAVEKGAAKRVSISLDGGEARLSAEFVNPKAELLDVIEKVYAVAEEVSRRFGGVGKPVLRLDGGEGGLRKNRIERLL